MSHYTLKDEIQAVLAHTCFINLLTPLAGVGNSRVLSSSNSHELSHFSFLKSWARCACGPAAKVLASPEGHRERGWRRETQARFQLVPHGVQLSLLSPASQRFPFPTPALGVQGQHQTEKNSQTETFTSSHMMLNLSKKSHSLCHAYCRAGAEFGTRWDSRKQNHKEEFSELFLG